MLISDRAEYILKIVYIILTIVLFPLMLLDLSFVYFGLLMGISYFIIRAFYERLIIIGVVMIYLICSLLFALRIDPLMVLQQFILQGSVSTMFEMYLFMGGFIALGILFGLVWNRFRLYYVSVLILGVAIVAIILDSTAFHVITANYLLNCLFYLATYFLLFGLEFMFWFISIYALKQYLIVELEEPETIVEISRPS